VTAVRVFIPLAKKSMANKRKEHNVEKYILLLSFADDLEPLRLEFLDLLTDDYSSEFIIEVCQVERRLSNINICKAPGPDQLPSWILRDFAPLIAEPLGAIFNTSIREGKVPDIWKSAVVIPAPKINPPRSISSDLRPISLLPVLAKVLESFVVNWPHDLLASAPVTEPRGGLGGTYPPTI